MYVATSVDIPVGAGATVVVVTPDDEVVDVSAVVPETAAVVEMVKGGLEVEVGIVVVEIPFGVPVAEVMEVSVAIPVEVPLRLVNPVAGVEVKSTCQKTWWP